MSDVDRLRATFREQAGRDAEGVWSAPGRVELIGGHTDYNEGLVLPFAIDRRTTVAAARRDDGMLVAYSTQRRDEPARVAVDALDPASGSGWVGYVAGVVWALRAAGFGIEGLEVVVDSTVPTGSGLSSSAALECAVAAAATDLYGCAASPAELARIAQRAENDFVGVPCGLMDQMAAMACSAGSALLFDTRSGDTEQVPLAVDAAGLRILVLDTRVHHELADGAYAQRRAECEKAAARLGVAALRDVDPAGLAEAERMVGDDVAARRMRHVVTENARVAEAAAWLRAGRIAEVGPVLTASHRSLRDDFEVSCAELDVAVDAARGAGALGARMTGGGFGGSAIALVPAAWVDAVGAAVRAAYADAGYAEPDVWAVTPSAGARRDA